MAKHLVIFDSITGETICTCALKTNGGAGPSGIDAEGWRRMCTSFRNSSHLCSSRLWCKENLHCVCWAYTGLSTLIASRLIALKKRPSVRPIVIGEVSWRIISKAILTILADEVREVAECIQLCAGQEAGCEAGVRAMAKIFDDDNTEAALLVDATNAFNLLSRRTALINIHATCPSIATALTNIYREDGNLYIQRQVLKSKEGVMQLRRSARDGHVYLRHTTSCSKAESQQTGLVR